jgi:hypothetical protein
MKSVRQSGRPLDMNREYPLYSFVSGLGLNPQSTTLEWFCRCGGVGRLSGK